MKLSKRQYNDIESIKYFIPSKMKKSLFSGLFKDKITDLYQEELDARIEVNNIINTYF